jgi:alpha-tubulin suppressor-like RCC1 family protein
MAPDLDVDLAPDMELDADVEDLAPDLMVSPCDGVVCGPDERCVEGVCVCDAPGCAPNRPPVFTSSPPATASEGDTLRYTVRCEDPEGAAVMLSGAPDDTCNGQLVGDVYVTRFSEEQGGRSCTLKIECSDGELTTVQATSIAVAEVNDVPLVMEVIIVPIPIPSAGGPLTCQYTYVDGEMDPDQSQVEWIIGGRVVATGPTLPTYPPGVAVRCRVTPSDGMNTGAPITSGPVTTPDAITVAAGGAHTCAIRSGALYCWGANTRGQLGGGPPAGRLAPALVPNMGRDVTALAAGGARTCAVKAGALWCWGEGVGAAPQVVPGMGAGVTTVAVSAGHTCAIRSGALWCWGDNASGQVGDGTAIRRAAPAAVVGMGAGVTAVWTGGAHTCAIRTSTLWCWGDNTSGQLGDGATAPRLVPRLVSPAQSAAAGASHTCRLDGGALSCWGRNREWQLGAGVMTLMDERLPLPVAGLGAGVGLVWSGARHTCAIQSGALSCWGDNYSGQIGDNTVTGQRPAPTAVRQMDVGVTGGAAGDAHTCAVRDAALWCWGDNAAGQVGDGTTQRRYVPRQVMWP